MVGYIVNKIVKEAKEFFHKVPSGHCDGHFYNVPSCHGHGNFQDDFSLNF